LRIACDVGSEETVLLAPSIKSLPRVLHQAPPAAALKTKPLGGGL
jgi:hypothetical protein